MERPCLEAQGLHKRFGALEAVKKVHLTLRPGEILAFLGKKRRGQKHHGEDAFGPPPSR